MESAFLVFLGLAAGVFGWTVYSRFIARRILRLDPEFITPAHAERDGTDFVPTNKYILWGHHFTSVAGAAPIVGPAIAVYWGWVPAVLWVCFGTIFFAGVHDMGAIWASNRHSGKSIGALSEDVVGKRTRALFMIVVFLLLLMVNAVFGVVIARAFVNTPSAVVPAWSAIVVALVIGQLVHRNFPLTMLSIVGVVVLYLSIYAGSQLPLELPPVPGLSSQAGWILLLFAYAAIASMLPVWVLLQPRDYINGMQLFIGLALLYGAVFLTLPDITAPPINYETGVDGPSMLPLLFVTIACGAVSGFHGIVSSGTTSKQLDNEKDARFVGYFGALGEGALALITIVAVSSASFAGTPELWHQVYETFGSAGASAFIDGGAALISEGWHLPFGLSQSMLATMVVLFAGTTMDTGVRLQRYIIQEWGVIYRIPWLSKPATATGFAIGSCLLLAFGAGGSSGDGGLVIWPLFGSANQILAGLTLMVISLMLLRLGRPVRYTFVPMILVLALSFWAATLKLVDFYREGNVILVCIDLLVIVTSVLVMLEATSAFVTERKNRQRDRKQDSRPGA